MPFELPDIWTLSGIALALIAIGPAMTSVPSPSHREFWISRICFIAASVLFLGKVVTWGAEDLTPHRIAIVAIAGAAIAIGLTFALHWVGKKEAATQSAPAPPLASSSKEAMLYVECRAASVPVIVPPNGRLYWIPLWPYPAERVGGGIIELSLLKPGEPYRFAEHEGLGSLYQCQITNYAQTPVFNVAMTLGLRYREAIRGENRITAGKTTLERPWPFQIAKIDAGASNPFVFYFVNQFPLFIDITMPKEATLRPLGETQPQRSTLTYNDAIPIILFPGQEPESPPALQSPAPAPQAPQPPK